LVCAQPDARTNTITLKLSISLEKNFMCSFKSPTCKSYHNKIISIKIRPIGPPIGVPDQDVIGLQPGRDQVIGVEVKILQPKSRKHVSNHFLFYKKSSKMQFSMIWANLKNLSLFCFSHFGCHTLYSARHYSEMAFSALL
jgi:hypothetical protein